MIHAWNCVVLLCKREGGDCCLIKAVTVKCSGSDVI